MSQAAEVAVPATPQPEGYRIRDEILIPPRRAASIRLRRGEILQIVDVRGQQVSDVMSWVLSDPGEYLSPVHTMSCTARVIPRVGDSLYSNRRRSLLRIARDSVGRHDLLVGCCDPYRYERQLGAPGHPSCLQAIEQALAAAGETWTPRSELAWNVFMNNVINPDGSIVLEEPVQGPGGYVEVEALDDLGLVGTACPQDLTPCNAWVITEIAFRVFEPEA
jgi:uncharacterized protein